MGEGDLHERSWNDKKVTISFHDPDTPFIDGNCLYSLEVYPSDELHAGWDEKMPTVFACVVAATFVITAMTFGLYDRFTRQRNKKVVNAAAKTDRIVQSLFPSNIRDRLLAEEEDFEKRQGEKGARTRLKDFLANDGPVEKEMESTDDFMYKTKPIADLFPETTIMFADVSIHLRRRADVGLIGTEDLTLFPLFLHKRLPDFRLGHPLVSRLRSFSFWKLFIVHLMSTWL